MKKNRNITTKLTAQARGFFLGLCLVLFVGVIQAQPVPNFIAKDINGNEHDLHAYLDDGKVVILEVFATWCTNCWNLHKSERLRKLYSTYGPEGTDQLMILFVEGDVETSEESLYEENSFGDWVVDIPYPIFSPSAISQDFNDAFVVNGFPTSNVICPQTKEIVADVFQDDLTKVISILQQCNTISNVHDLQVSGPDLITNLVCNTTELKLNVLNSGTEEVTSFEVVALDKNGSEIVSNDYEFVIHSGEEVSINLGEYVLPDLLEEEHVTLSIKSIDDVQLNNQQIITFSGVPKAQNELQLIINADFWAEQDNTRWWVENSQGEIVVPVTPLVAELSVVVFFGLENSDCFTFVLAEDYGDGMLEGSVELFTSEGVLIYEDTNFTDKEEAEFKYLGFAATATTALDPNKYGLTLSPNIVTDVLKTNYKIPHNQKVEFQIINLQGTVITSQPTSAIQGENNWEYNTQYLPNGIYLIQMQTKQGSLTRKFIKQ